MHCYTSQAEAIGQATNIQSRWVSVPVHDRYLSLKHMIWQSILCSSQQDLQKLLELSTSVFILYEIMDGSKNCMTSPIKC